MTPEVRLQVTVAFKSVDRVVCGPFVYGYAASYAGVTQAQFINDFGLAQRCMDKLKTAYPVWDLYRPSFTDLGYGPTLRYRWFQKVALTGDDFPEDTPYQIRGCLGKQSGPLSEFDRVAQRCGQEKTEKFVGEMMRPYKRLVYIRTTEALDLEADQHALRGNERDFGTAGKNGEM